MDKSEQRSDKVVINYSENSEMHCFRKHQSIDAVKQSNHGHLSSGDEVK